MSPNPPPPPPLLLARDPTVSFKILQSMVTHTTKMPGVMWIDWKHISKSIKFKQNHLMDFGGIGADCRVKWSFWGHYNGYCVFLEMKSKIFIVNKGSSKQSEAPSNCDFAALVSMPIHLYTASVSSSEQVAMTINQSMARKVTLFDIHKQNQQSLLIDKMKHLLPHPNYTQRQNNSICNY